MSKNYQWEIGFDWNAQTASGLQGSASSTFPVAMGMATYGTSGGVVSPAQMASSAPDYSTMTIVIYDITSWTKNPSATSDFSFSNWSFNLHKASSGGSQTAGSPLYNGSTNVTTIDSTNYGFSAITNATSNFFSTAVSNSSKFAWRVGTGSSPTSPFLFSIQTGGRYYFSTKFSVTYNSKTCNFGLDPEMIIEVGA